jgi:hypothetical protein
MPQLNGVPETFTMKSHRVIRDMISSVTFIVHSSCGSAYVAVATVSLKINPMMKNWHFHIC